MPFKASPQIKIKSRIFIGIVSRNPVKTIMKPNPNYQSICNNKFFPIFDPSDNLIKLYDPRLLPPIED